MKNLILSVLVFFAVNSSAADLAPPRFNNSGLTSPAAELKVGKAKKARVPRSGKRALLP